MKGLPVVSSKDAIKALKKGGFDYAPKRGKGSHIALYKIDEKGRKFLVIVPKRKEIPKGTLFSIMGHFFEKWGILLQKCLACVWSWGAPYLYSLIPDTLNRVR